ncbi:hypothetical protein ACFQ1I_33600 [Kitasatospora arboriphila]
MPGGPSAARASSRLRLGDLLQDGVHRAARRVGARVQHRHQVRVPGPFGRGAGRLREPLGLLRRGARPGQDGRLHRHAELPVVRPPVLARPRGAEPLQQFVALAQQLSLHANVPSSRVDRPSGGSDGRSRT